MPVMDGLEFVKQLPGVENAKGVPVVMITTEGREAHVMEALSAGARGLYSQTFHTGRTENVLRLLVGKA